jgi:hypothetical protein
MEVKSGCWGNASWSWVGYHFSLAPLHLNTWPLHLLNHHFRRRQIAPAAPEIVNWTMKRFQLPPAAAISARATRCTIIKPAGCRSPAASCPIEPAERYD